MALFVLKPILWNRNNYRTPSGVKASPDSFPGENGFGHEEWNSSPRLAFKERGQSFRVFHTEGLGNAPVETNQGQIFVLMIASHDGIQQLVGIAGNAFYLGYDASRSERERLVSKLKLEDLGHDVWEVPNVRTLFKGSQAKFQRVWKRDVSWIPNWICPADTFWWPEHPVTLDAKALTGKAALPKMFGSYKDIDIDVAQAIMRAVPLALRNRTWMALLDAMGVAALQPIPAIQADDPIDPKATARMAMAQCRIGQGQFREDVLNLWDRTCAVTGLAYSELLRASHIKGWKESSDKQRLDQNNGLPLSAHLDALFDAHLISFEDSGQMLVSARVSPQDCETLGLSKPLRKTPWPALCSYLALHREVYQVKSSQV